MNKQLDQIFTAFLGGADALSPSKLGPAAAPAPAAPAPAKVDRFVEALASCRDSTRTSAGLLFATFIVLLLGLLGLLYLARQGNASAMVLALLGSTGAASLVAIPVRMQSLWKDQAIMEMTLAILPGQPPKEQLALIKTLHAASRPGARG